MTKDFQTVKEYFYIQLLLPINDMNLQVNISVLPLNDKVYTNSKSVVLDTIINSN